MPRKVRNSARVVPGTGGSPLNEMPWRVGGKGKNPRPPYEWRPPTPPIKGRKK